MSDYSLTKMDIDKLLDAMEIWETNEEQILQTHEYLRSMHTEPEKLAEFDKVTAPKVKELEAEAKIKRDMSIILKFKLVKMKESIDAQKILDGLTKHDNTN